MYHRVYVMIISYFNQIVLITNNYLFNIVLKYIALKFETVKILIHIMIVHRCK